MPRKTVGEKGKRLRKAGSEWEWLRRYRVWDADRKIFLYPENWIEPELHLTTRFRESLHDMVALIRAKCRPKTKRKRIRRPVRRRDVRVVLTGKNRMGALVAAETVASGLGTDLYRIDLRSIVDKYIGDTEKNLSHVFDAAKKSNAVLFFDETDVLFGKRSEVKD